MLFNSNEFIFIFFPLVLIGFFCSARIHYRLGTVWLTAASLFFYGWWNTHFLLLLIISATINYFLGLTLNRIQRINLKKSVLISAITFNLALLAIFKYANFFMDTAHYFNNKIDFHFSILLPLGISFYTFTQIAFLVDVYRGLAKEYNFVHYLLFVTYFPHLVAGPILHHKQMMPQFASSKTYQVHANNIATGISIFIIGLTKKVLLADGFAIYATTVFHAVDKGVNPSWIMAWTGALAYTFQLYFDFSGYTDMAIGLSRIFGINLPINFYSPYQSHNIIEFWRRWHISLSTFLRDYLYIPLGGNRRGKLRRHCNLLITMLLGGLWHGASWTFVVWGGLHGLYLILNHGWQWLSQKLSLPHLPRILTMLLTFIAVVVAWVFFRADTFQTALKLLEAMFTYPKLPSTTIISSFTSGICALFDKTTTSLVTIQQGYFLGPASIGFFIIWLLPNTSQLFEKYEEDKKHRDIAPAKMKWEPSFSWALLIVFILSADFIKNFGINLPPSPFLYFQF